MMYMLLRVSCVALFWITISSAQTFEFTLKVWDSDPTLPKISIVVGMHPSATGNFDAAYDQYAPPAPPVSGIFDARSRFSSVDYYKDIRTSTSNATEYTILTEPKTGSTLGMSWDQAAATAIGTVEIWERFGGMVLDMTATDTLDFTTNSNLTAQGGLRVIITNADPALPVGLSSFSANVNDGQVQLSWVTQSEVQNQGFEVYRAEPGGEYDLLASFATSAALEGAGNSNVEKQYSYQDVSTRRETTYRYRLSDVSYSGARYFHPPITVSLVESEALPQGFQLHQNFPNPFNPGTTITFDLSETAPVSLEVFNILGESIDKYGVREYPPGRHQLFWDGANRQSGIYFYQVRAGNAVFTRRMMLLK